MAVDIDTIKRLKSLTGVGLTDAKKALEESNGDFDKALESMRVKGMAKADKKAGRIAAEGIIGAKVSADGKAVAIVDINCETDFVAKADDFVSFVNNVTLALLNADIETEEQLLSMKFLNASPTRSL